MEQYLKDALESLRKAQLEIVHPCEAYNSLDDMQFKICDMLENKIWLEPSVTPELDMQDAVKASGV